MFRYFNYQAGKANKILKSSLEPLSFLPNNSTNKKLGGYLAGLIEGDGSIIVPKTIRNQKGPDACGWTCSAGRLLYFFGQILLTFIGYPSFTHPDEIGGEK